MKAQKKIKISQIKPDFVLFDRVDFYDNRRELYLETSRNLLDLDFEYDEDNRYRTHDILIEISLIHKKSLLIDYKKIYPIIDTLWINCPLKDSAYKCGYLSSNSLLFNLIKQKKNMLLWFNKKLPNTIKIPEIYKKNKVTLRFRFKNKTYILSTNNINFIVK